MTGAQERTDVYGFPLTLPSEEVDAYLACQATADKRAARDWADGSTATRGRTLRHPLHKSLKSRCRKVRLEHVKVC